MIRGATARGGGERGYAMAALLVTIAIISVALGVAMQSWRTVVQRDKEEELIFRGRQYARAVGLFQRRFANAYPPSFDVLVEQKFLRKLYKDPMTEDGKFVVLYQGSAFTLPGAGRGASAPGPGGQQTGGGSSTLGTGGSSFTTGRQGGSSSTFGQTGRGGAGPQGNVIGVVSASEEKSLKILDGRTQYSEWRFIWLPTSAPGRGGGANQPGGRGGPGGPGGLGPGQGRGQGPGRGGPFGNPGQGPGGGRQPGGGRGPGN